MILLQTELYKPMEEAFRSGALVMSDQAQRLGEGLVSAWGDQPVNWILVIVSAFAFAFSLPTLYHIFPHIVKSFSRWRWNFTIEASLQLSRTRDTIAFLCVVPFCLIVSRYHLFGGMLPGAAADVPVGVSLTPERLDLFSRVPQAWFTPAVLGVFVAYYLLRTVTYLLLETRVFNTGTFQVARKAERNFFVCMTFLLLLGTGVLYAFKASENTIRWFLWIAMGVVYAVFLVRKSEILASVCNPLTTFLYLCALEFLPTGLMVAACLLL